MKRSSVSKDRTAAASPLAGCLEKPRPELVPALAKRLRHVVDHRTLELILRQSEEEAGID